MARGAGRALASDLHPQQGFPPAAAVLEAAPSAAASLAAAASAAAAAPVDLLPHEQAAIRVFEQNTPSVVNITHIRAMQNFNNLDVHRIPYGQGSGFVWNREGIIVTNAHITRGANEVKVGGRRAAAAAVPGPCQRGTHAAP
jgi:S1-C subfamily serine protease